MLRRSRIALLLALASLAWMPVTASAQASDSRPPRPPRDVEMLGMLQTLRVVNAEQIAPLINALLSDTASHMRMAPSRVASATDSLRAAGVVSTVRESLAKYTDVAAAERDGYVKFLPWLPNQSMYHWNHIGNALAALRTHDASKPSSLLYVKDADGTYRLIGAMYTAPANATPDQLDARLPLGMAHWHAHVDLCGPRVNPRDLAATPVDSATIAHWLAIDTREKCAAAGGVFVPQLFGWMAHVNAFDGTTPAEIWGGHGRNAMHRHRH